MRHPSARGKCLVRIAGTLAILPCLAWSAPAADKAAAPAKPAAGANQAAKPSDAPRSLIANGDFEDGTRSWITWGGQSSDSAHAGKGGAEIMSGSHTWKGMHQIVALPAGATHVEINGWMRTESVVPGKEPWENARITIEFLDSTGKMVGNYPPAVAEAIGTTPWTSYRKRLEITKGASQVKILLALGNATGRAWFDDLSVMPRTAAALARPAGDNQLLNGGFESDIDGWNAFGAEGDAVAHSGAGSARVVNKVAKWSGADQKLLLPAGAASVEVSGWIKTANVVRGKEPWENARISIEFLDAGGAMVGGYPPTTGEVVGTADWKLFHKKYTPPAGSAQIKLQIALGNATGTAWFDDVALVVRDAAGKPMAAGSLSGPTSEGEWYALPLGTSGGHYVDWSFLLDAPAGKHGFLESKGDGFRFKDGTQARFFGANLVGPDNFPTKAAADSLAARLSRMGCNLLRLHHLDAPWSSPNLFGNGPTTRKLDSAAMDQFDYLVAALKKKGIYIFLDLLVHREFRQQDGVTEAAPLGGKQVGIYDPRLIELQKEFASQLFAHKNKYTGLAYKDEPAIVASEFINESTIFTHFSGNEIKPAYAKVLDSLWQASPNKGKQLATFGLDWSLAHARLKATTPGDTAASLKFLSGLEASYYKGMHDHLRKIGVKYPLTGTNFPPQVLATLRNNAAMDFIISNDYWDHPQLWKLGDDWTRILEAPVNNTSQLRNPTTNLIRTKAWFQVAGRPLVITEWNHCYPNEYPLEGVPFIAAFGALQGWDGLLQFDIDHAALGTDRIMPFKTSRFPEHVAQWVVSAPLFLRGDIKRSEAELVEGLTEKDALSIPSYSELLDKSWWLPYAVRVSKSFDGKGKGAAADFQSLVDEKTGVVKSSTGELVYDSRAGVLQMRAPRIQGAMGFLADSTFDLPQLRVRVANSHASVLAIARRGESLTKADTIYLVAVGPTRMQGQQFNASRNALQSPGALPVEAQVVHGEVVLKLGRPADKIRVRPLSPTGRAGEALAVKAVADGAAFDLSAGRTHVYEITFAR